MKPNRLFLFHSILLLFAVFSNPVWAQVAANLCGSVTDPSGAAVQAANVEVKNLETGVVRNTATDPAGRYELSALPAGQYEIRGTKTGFSVEIRTGIRLVAGQRAAVDLKLQVGEASQQIVVSGDAPLVGVTTANVSGLVGDEQQIRNLPLNGRSYDELLTLNP